MDYFVRPSSKIHASVFEPQRRVGCRRTRRENEANAVLSVTRCFTTVSERVEVFASGSCRLTKSARARSHAARSGIHAEARRWSTSPPHHLTSRRRKKHANPPTTRCQLLLQGNEAYSVHVFQDLARDFVIMRLARARSLAARSGVIMEARRWSLVALAFAFVNLFW